MVMPSRHVRDRVLRAVGELPLLDHHAHGLRLATLSPEAFGDLVNESDSPAMGGLKAFDKPFGLNVRALCAPVLGLERGAPLDAYFAERNRLGGEEASRRLIAACNLSAALLDTYERDRVHLTDPSTFASTMGVAAHEILRLESLFETVAMNHGSAQFCDRPICNGRFVIRRPPGPPSRSCRYSCISG